MNKLFIFVALLLMLSVPVAAERFVQFEMFEGIIKEDMTFQPTTNPITNFKTYGFVCADPDCSEYSAQMYNGNPIQSGPGNKITVTYPTQLQSPWGYAHIYAKNNHEYITWVQRADFWGTNPNDPVGPFPIYLSKMEVCRSPIDSFNVINVAYPNQPIMFEMNTSLDSTVWAAMQEGGPVGFQAPQIPQNYEVETLVTLTIKDGNNNVINEQQKTVYLPFSGAKKVHFEWIPQNVGEFTATMRTNVPDAKCLSDDPAQTSKHFNVIAETSELCYALANGLNAQPLHQHPGDTVTIGVQTIANYYDISGNLFPMDTELTMTVEKDGFFDQQTITVPAADNVEQWQSTMIPYIFEEEGIYDITLGAWPLSCPFDESIGDTLTIEYQVQPGNATPNTPPVLNAPNIHLDEGDGLVAQIYNLEDFAFDPDQPADTLTYEIIEQTNTDVVQCTLDANNYVSCEVFNAGQSVLTYRVTDDEGDQGIQLITVFVAAAPVPELMCVDTDGGNPFTQGNLTLFLDDEIVYEATDFCLNEDTLRNFMCTADTEYVDGQPINVYEDINCPHGCEDGACRTEPVEPEVVCVDTDDGDIFTQGILQLILGDDVVFTAQDTCIDENNLKNYRCTADTDYVNGEPVDVYEMVTCEFGCEAGACNTEPDVTEPQLVCVDTDGGDPFTQGNLTLLLDDEIVYEATDFCIDDFTLRNFMCTADTDYVDGEPTNVATTIHCPLGCVNGACVQEDTPPQEPPEHIEYDQSRLFITRMNVLDADLMQMGFDGQLSVTVHNPGDITQRGVRIQVFVPELGLQTSAGPFVVNREASVTRQLIMPVYEPITPGWYTMRVSIWSEDLIRIKHREVFIG